MSRKSIKLLLVEDNAGDARLLREMFKEHRSQDIVLTHFQTMGEAETYLASNAVDVIVLDLGLSDAHGMEALRRAHRAAPRTPLVVLTGLDDESLAIQALKEGAQDYLVKGQIESRAVLRTLIYAVERKNLEEALIVEKERAQVTLASIRDGVASIARDDVRYPMRLLRFAFLLTLMAFGWFAWLIFDRGRDQIAYLDRLSMIEQLKTTIVHLDEVLTMSARMAAATGDPGWEKRYRHFEPPLGSAIKKLISLADNRYGLGEATRTAVANDRLVEMENRAFALIRAGRREEAKAVLFSTEYEEQKKIYLDGLTSFVGESRSEINRALVSEEHFDFLSLVGAVVVACIAALAWFSTIRGIQRWRLALEGSISERTLSTIGRDITERKRSDEALRTSEGRLRHLLDSNIIGVAFWNVDGHILKANDLFLKMIGYSQQDIESGNLEWTHLTPPEYAPAVAKAFAEMAAAGACTPFEAEMIRKDGRRVTVLVGSALLEGAIDTGTSFVMDITERKQAETTLRLQSAALSAAANAMVITERDLTIVWANPAFSKLTGYTNAEAIGSNVSELLRSGAHDEAFYQRILSTALAGNTWAGEITNRRKNGVLYPEALSVTPVKDSAGVISHLISVRADLTEQRQMEAQLRHSQKMEAVGQLGAGIAHEFNNLLQALMSMASIVRMRCAHADIVKKTGTEMEVQIKRGATITQQLLMFSRRHAVEKSDLDLREQIQKTTTLLRRLIPENIRMVVEKSANVLLSTEGDAGEIQQVLLNLAINARDAMPSGGTLTLRAGSFDDKVFLEIEDTGSGIDEATRTRIFEPFFTTKGVGKGSGLGLAVVQRIVEQHGGQIEVHSSPGEGSRFRVVLPAAAPARIVVPQTVVDTALPAGSGRILLVEDEEGVRAGIAALLEILGYQVTAVGSGEEAIAIALDAAPDLLLSDVTLPGMAGLALGERLSERWPSLKVVLMSGYVEEDLHANAIERGWQFLQKPFELTDLALRLREALDGQTPTAAAA